MIKKSAASASCFELVKAIGDYIEMADAELRAEIESAPPSETQKKAAVVEQRNAEANVELSDVVVIEHCINCKAHSVHLRHDEQKYLNFAQQLSAAIAAETGKPTQTLYNEVPKAWADRDTYCQLIPCYDDKRMCYSMIPRVGAFEVSICGVIIFSKLCLQYWPHVPSVAKRVAACLKDKASGMDEGTLKSRYEAQSQSKTSLM